MYGIPNFTQALSDQFLSLTYKSKLKVSHAVKSLIRRDTSIDGMNQLILYFIDDYEEHITEKMNNAPKPNPPPKLTSKDPESKLVENLFTNIFGNI